MGLSVLLPDQPAACPVPVGCQPKRCYGVVLKVCCCLAQPLACKPDGSAVCPLPTPAVRTARAMQAFGACLQRTRLRTFLWTQPLLLAPLLWTGNSHCSRQLAATPEAAGHVERIAAAMRRASTWLPMGTLPGHSLRGGGGGAAAAAAAAAAEAPQSACLAVHLWLVLVLSFCLPAIVIHRLEGQELQAEDERKQRQQRQRGGDNGGGSGASRWRRAAAPRQLLLQRPPSLMMTAAELLLAAFTAWQAVQAALLAVGQ